MPIAMNICKIEEDNHKAFSIQNPLFPSNFSLNFDNLTCNQTFLDVEEINFGAQYLSYISSTSNEAEEQPKNQVDERKHRRMLSNRESARRSRMRKKRQINELWSHVLRLRTENHALIDKLEHVSESHNQVLQENTRLKEETSNLRQMLTYMKLDTDDVLHNALRYVEDN